MIPMVAPNLVYQMENIEEKPLLTRGVTEAALAI
jgi:hypothetical protein